MPALTSILLDGGLIAFSARIDNNWDIYAINPTTRQAIRLTADPAEDRFPAFSPDGQSLAFASRRSGYWKLYLLKPDGQIVQLTGGTDYDGAPAWSPDGAQIAFESMRAGNLDIWTLDLRTKELHNWTADSPRADGSPVWSPDGNQIAFTSWRYEDADILVLDVQTGEVRQFTSTPTDEYLFQWSGDGELVYTLTQGETQDAFSRPADLDPEKAGRQLTRRQFVDAPVRSPDGQFLAFLLRHTHGARLYLQQPEVELDLSIRLTDVFRENAELPMAGPLSWTATTAPWKETHREPTILYREQTHPGDGSPYDLVRLKEVDVGSPWLSDRVDDSFVAMRQRIIAESGRDFLAQLSDAWREISYEEEWADYTSWHKTGRAIDTLMDYLSPDHRKRWLEVMLEPGGGEIYWRLYLYCEKQDGSQGMPLKTRPWDLTYEARQALTGGRRKPLPNGYYVDLTDLMAQYGWLRIAAHDSPDFHWHTNFIAVEHWHFQKTDDLRWYEAMLEVFPSKLVEMHHRWEVQKNKGMPLWLAAAKGIPLPWKERRMLERLTP